MFFYRDIVGWHILSLVSCCLRQQKRCHKQHLLNAKHIFHGSYGHCWSATLITAKEHFLDQEVLDAAGRAKLQDVLGRFQSSLDAEADWETVPWTALVGIDPDLL